MKYQQMYDLSSHEAAGYVIARRSLGKAYEKIPEVLLDKLIAGKSKFKQITNWKQWSAVKKAAIAEIEKTIGRKVKSLVSWQANRKQVLGKG